MSLFAVYRCVVYNKTYITLLGHKLPVTHKLVNTMSYLHLNVVTSCLYRDICPHTESPYLIYFPQQEILVTKSTFSKLPI